MNKLWARISRGLIFCGMISLSMCPLLTAQVLRQREAVPLKPWAAPLYWQMSPSEPRAEPARPEAAGAPFPHAQLPVDSLVFVGMTPCRVADTRYASGFTGDFGPPNLAARVSRTFPIRSSPNCAIPPIAQAYSFNVTVVPLGLLGFLTVYPTGSGLPNASTLNSLEGFIVANAAIVPAGINGSVDLYANDATDVIIDINGYYAPQSGITLAQGSALAPSLSFANDAGTGIFSSGAGNINFTTGGINSLIVTAAGDLD